METWGDTSLARPIQRELITSVVRYLIPVGSFIAVTGLMTNFMSSFHLTRVLVNVLVLALLLISGLLLRRGVLQWGFGALFCGVLIAFVVSVLGIGGVMSPNYGGFMLVLVTISVLSPQTKLLIVSYLGFVLIGALSFLPTLGLYDPPSLLSPFRVWTLEVFYGLSITVVLYFARRARASMHMEIGRREAQLSSVIRSIGEPLIISNLAGSELEMNSSARLLNDAFIEQTGDELLDAPLTELNHNQRVTLRELISQGERAPKHIQVRRAGELPTWYAVSLSLQYQDDQPSGVVLMLRDLTDQQHLIQAQKMSAIGVLADGIAHDFNNMLGAIQNASELLSLELEDEEQLEMVELITEATQRSSALVRQLRLFSKSSPTSQSLMRADELLTQVQLQLQNVRGPAQLLRLELDDRGAELEGDATQLKAALVNLGLNALQSSQETGQVSLRAYRKTLDEVACQRGVFNPQPGEFVCFEVQDEGEGIRPEVRDRIFEPFFTTRGVGKGSGLGLSTVFGAAQSHQGIIEVESELNRGSTFRLYLPLAAQRAVAKEPTPSDEAQALLIKRALIIDDERLIRRSLQGMLESLGVSADTAGSGDEGIRLLKGGADFDLIILDMQMPERSGRDVFYELREGWAHIPVVISSGFSPEGVIEELTAQGLTGVLSKPYRMSELKRTLQEVSALKPEA